MSPAIIYCFFFFFQAEDGIRDYKVTGVQTCALPISFLWKTVEWVVSMMGPAYPELVAERARIQDAVRGEEERFAETLDTGTLKIKDYLDAHASDTRRVVDGRFLFTLYDTYGFPMDLAEEFFQDAGWRVTDATRATAAAEMEAQRARAPARAA